MAYFTKISQRNSGNTTMQYFASLYKVLKIICYRRVAHFLMAETTEFVRSCVTPCQTPGKLNNIRPTPGGEPPVPKRQTKNLLPHILQKDGPGSTKKLFMSIVADPRARRACALRIGKYSWATNYIIFRLK